MPEPSDLSVAVRELGRAHCGCIWPSDCAGSGALACAGCGGDLCICLCGGERSCDGCEDCERDELDEDLDDPDPDDEPDPGCVLGDACVCPHIHHTSDECCSVEQAEAYHRAGEAEENPAGGDCEVCGDLTGMATMVCRLPEHNGVEAYPRDGRLCTACAYDLAEHLSEWAEKERAHARACGATIPMPRSEERTDPVPAAPPADGRDRCAPRGSSGEVP